MKYRISIVTCFSLIVSVSYCQAVWSPHGDRIIVRIENAGKNKLVMVDTSGNILKTVWESTFNILHPSWSPDGTMLLFDSNHQGNKEIYVLQLETRKLQRLTNHDSVDLVPSWSPDGARISFNSRRNGNWDVFIMNRDGTGLKQITSSPGMDITRSWAWQQNAILYDSDQEGGRHIYQQSLEDGQTTMLTNQSYRHRIATGSPLGVTYSRIDEGEERIYLLDRNGNHTELLKGTSGNQFYAIWSPDGKHFTYISDVSGERLYYLHHVESGMNKLLIQEDNDYLK